MPSGLYYKKLFQALKSVVIMARLQYIQYTCNFIVLGEFLETPQPWPKSCASEIMNRKGM